jgi:hypothetical protein
LLGADLLGKVFATRIRHDIDAQRFQLIAHRLAGKHRGGLTLQALDDRRRPVSAGALPL